jgi:diguanylate cyclase (GGDEF)-like protein
MPGHRPISVASRVLPWAAGVLAAGAIWAVLQTFVWLEQDRRSQAERAVLQAEAATVRARLESTLNATLSLSLGLSTFVLTKPEFTEADLAPIAASLIRMQPAIRNVAIAPDNEISFVYPRKGNEKALGLRYLHTPNQREAVLRLMREQRPITAGPLELAQGGVGIINRIPIVFTQADGSSRYWGLASVMIDPRPIFEQAGLLDSRSGVRFALRGKDGLGERGAVFLGDAALFDKPDAVRMNIIIPGGTWQLVAARAVPTATRGVGLQALLLLLAAGVGGLVGYSLSAHQRIRDMAMYDSLTGLANRHQFNLRGHDMFALAKRSGRPLTLLNIDVDDFKSVNDTFGHAAGDTVLVQVAHTLRDCFRETDLLARLGGDEFVVLLPDTSKGPALDALLDRLRNAVEVVLPGSAPVRLGISVGVAVCSVHTASLDALMRQADEAMYLFKERVQQSRPAG